MKNMEKLSQRERDVITYLKWYSELDAIPNTISKASDGGILTNEQRRYLYQLNLKKLLGLEEVEDDTDDNTFVLEKTRYGGITKSL
jgi:hypothetical protein